MTMHELKAASSNGSAPGSATYEAASLIAAGMQAVEQVLHDVVDSEVDVLRDASRHILSAGGKRIRPRMAILSFVAAGGQDVTDIARIAAAVELVHTASIVHDDINDHGVMRRGRKSVNARWGRTFALLTGDFLFTKVYELMAPYKDLNVVLSEATVALVEGETLQAAAVKNNMLNREVYNRIIALKTAALFKAAAKLGALVAGTDAHVVQHLGNYGYNVGLAFQVIDDILDLTADSEQLGKTAGIDLAQGRGIAAAAARDGDDTQVADPMDTIKRKLLTSDAIAEGRQQAEMLATMAANELDVLPDSPEKDALLKISRLVIERDS